MRLTINALAERELEETIQFDDREREGLGLAFLDEVRRTCPAISDFPEANPVILGTVRRRLCHRFPYALLYEIKHDEIRILAVMNQKRRPHYWADRR